LQRFMLWLMSNGRCRVGGASAPPAVRPPRLVNHCKNA
jgi:hypothetical protein